MKIRQSIPFALSVLSASLTSAALAAPTSGAYTTDKQNTWVQDRVGDRISTVNMIMCVMGSMKGDQMVNKGTYIALIDMGKCESRGDSSKASSTNAGASNATDYMSAVVTATQASTTDPLIVKAWMHEEEDGHKATIYAYVEATEGKSDSHPNGLFKMYFCGSPEMAPSTCMFKGSLQSTANGLSFYEVESHGGSPSETKLILQNSPSTDSGQGLIAGVESHDGGGGGATPYSYAFAYNTAQFRRNDGTSDVCFNRDKAAAEYSTWRYGTYKGDGSRLDLANPGFPVKYVNGSSTYYGYWSFWGLWLPETAMTAIASGSGTLSKHTDGAGGGSDVALTVVKRPGKLWKLTKHNATLNDFKNVPMMFWSPQNVGSLQAGHNYELKWDGTNLQAVSEQSCGSSGCSSSALSSPVTIDASTLWSSIHVKSLPIFFPSGGGNGMIDVPTSGGFSSSTTVFYRTREVVSPTSSTTLNLDCLSQCPKSGSALTTALTDNDPSTDPFVSGTWGPSGSILGSYTFSSGNFTHDNNSSAAVDASGVSKSGMGNFQWGLTSGSMIDHADLASVKCDNNGSPNTSGSYYCPGLVDQAAVVYQWETGPNQWNQFFGASGITFDPPKSLTFVASANPANIRAADTSKFDGSTVQLNFSGFGEMHGIPGHCVNWDTNQKTECGPNTRYVPAFDILDGAAVSEGSTSYYVKYLEREMRLSKLTCNGSSPSLPSSSSMTLPSSSLVDVDARTKLGAEPTPSSSKPSVIDGIVQ